MMQVPYYEDANAHIHPIMQMPHYENANVIFYDANDPYRDCKCKSLSHDDVNALYKDCKCKGLSHNDTNSPYEDAYANFYLAT